MSILVHAGMSRALLLGGYEGHSLSMHTVILGGYKGHSISMHTVILGYEGRSIKCAHCHTCGPSTPVSTAAS